ncbi:MAG: hypothetical protein HC923_00010 [Myxococcales bacterium]|nr:hypothetical protein [Myxococcales bacterium]
MASEFLNGMEVAASEDRVDDLDAELERLRDLGERAFDAPMREALERDLEAEREREKRRLEGGRKAQLRSARDLPVGFDHELSGAVEDMTEHLDEASEALAAFGLSGALAQDARTRRSAWTSAMSSFGARSSACSRDSSAR